MAMHGDDVMSQKVTCWSVKQHISDILDPREHATSKYTNKTQDYNKNILCEGQGVGGAEAFIVRAYVRHAEL